MPELLSHAEMSIRPDIYGRGSAREVPYLQRLFKANDIHYLGDGVECIVGVRKGHKENLAIAFNYYEFERKNAIRLFHAQKILNTLFPHNFPAFYTVYVGDHDGRIPGGSIRQKIDVVQEKSDCKPNYEKLIKYPFANVLKAVAETQLPVGFDSYFGNYCVAPDGGEYFLDTTTVYALWEDTTVLTYMRQNGYKPEEIKDVKRSVERILKTFKS